MNGVIVINNLKKNVMLSFGGQFVIIVLGIIIPRIMIDNYGSDVNGLLSTVTQIFTYMSLLEAGIGQATRNALYKPIIENDRQGISYVASTSRRYFHKITVLYGTGVVILSAIAPLVLKTKVDYVTVFLVIFFEGISGVVAFYYIETQMMILVADGKAYINNTVNVVNKTAGYAAKLFMASLGINIAFLQFAYFVITVLKSFFYRSYFKKNYGWLDYNAAPKNAKLKDRNAYILSEIAWTMFSSTDMIILSVFVSTRLSSVYGVYNMIFVNLNVLLNSIYTGVNYVLGQAYHEDKKKYVKLHDIYTSIFLAGMTIMMCVAYMLIIPFVRLYTRGIDDVDYINQSLPVMFCLVQIISWSRYITGNLTAIAGYAKRTSRISVIEATVNIILSVILVKRFGIVGVLLATVAALPLKVIYCAYLSDKIILRRSYKRTVCILGVNYLLFAVTVFLGRNINIQIENFMEFAVWGIVLSTVFSVIGIGVNFGVNSDCIQFAKELILKNKKR